MNNAVKNPKKCEMKIKEVTMIKRKGRSWNYRQTEKLLTLWK